VGSLALGFAPSGRSPERADRYGLDYISSHHPFGGIYKRPIECGITRWIPYTEHL